MKEDPQEPILVDLTFMDVQGIGTLPEPVNRMAALVTKAAMGAFLAYFSLNELMIELKAYRGNVARGEHNNGR